MDGGTARELELEVREAEIEEAEGDFFPVRLVTNRGDVECRHYDVPGARLGVIFVGGVGGGFDTPARELYPRLASDLMGERIASLRVRFRHPTVLEEATLDVLAGIAFLEHEGVDTIALVGHSFGGAVVIQAAAISPFVRTVVTLATQGYGADPVSDLPSDTSILLLHGTRDQVLAPGSSRYVYAMAHEPKRLELLEGADHGLDQAAEEIYRTVREWIVGELNAPVV